MASLTFDQKLAWLEGAQQLVADMHGWEAALLPSGSTIVPRWKQPAPPGGPPDHSTDAGEVGAGAGMGGAGAAVR